MKRAVRVFLESRIFCREECVKTGKKFVDTGFERGESRHEEFEITHVSHRPLEQFYVYD